MAKKKGVAKKPATKKVIVNEVNEDGDSTVIDVSAIRKAGKTPKEPKVKKVAKAKKEPAPPIDRKTAAEVAPVIVRHIVQTKEDDTIRYIFAADKNAPDAKKDPYIERSGAVPKGKRVEMGDLWVMFDKPKKVHLEISPRRSFAIKALKSYSKMVDCRYVITQMIEVQGQELPF